LSRLSKETDNSQQLAITKITSCLTYFRNHVYSYFSRTTAFSKNIMISRFNFQSSFWHGNVEE